MQNFFEPLELLLKNCSLNERKIIINKIESFLEEVKIQYQLT